MLPDFMTKTSTMIELPEPLRQLFEIDHKTIGGITGTGKRKHLTIFGLDGRVGPKFELAPDFRFIVGVDQSQLWLAFDERLEQRTLLGETISELEFQFEPDSQRIGTAVIANEELFIAFERLKDGPDYGLSGELVRMRKNGDMVWGSTLLVDRIEYAGCVEATAKNGFENLPKPAWKPRTWVTDSQSPILVSGNHVFASWLESPRSGIGKHYAVRLEDGHPVAITAPLPVSGTFNLGDGTALISAGGYGACQTVRLDPTSIGSGQVDLRWQTHGRFIQMPDGNLYCVEMFHGSTSNAHVVRLLPDGSTEKIGEPLPGYHTSQPLKLSDEVFCFWRDNQVWICDSNSNSLTSVSSTTLHELAYAHAISLESRKVAIGVTQNSQGSKSAKSIMVIVESAGNICR